MKDLDINVNIRSIKNGFLVYFGNGDDLNGLEKFGIVGDGSISGEYHFDTVNSALEAVKEYMEKKIRYAPVDPVQQLNG